MLLQSRNSPVATQHVAGSVSQSVSMQLFSSRELHHAALHYICSTNSGFVLESTIHELPNNLTFPSTLEPDLVIIEVALLARDEAMRATLSHICELTAVILLAEQMDAVAVRQAIVSGVSGYLLTSVSLDEFRLALQTVATGGLWFGQKSSNTPNRPPFAERMVRSLSQRERQILNYVANGLTSKEVASKIGLSQSSVRTYWYRVLNKLNALNKAEALVRSAHLGLLDSGYTNSLE